MAGHNRKVLYMHRVKKRDIMGKFNVKAGRSRKLGQEKAEKSGTVGKYALIT